MSRNESILSEQSYEEWFTPFNAVQMLLAAGLDDTEHAVNWLVARLKSGELQSAGINYEITEQLGMEEPFICLWDRKIWKNVSSIGWKDDFWISGDYSDPEDGLYLDSYDVLGFDEFLIQIRFEPKLIEAFCTPTVAASPQPAPHQQKGGRPPKPFWDRLWAAIAAQIYRGDWKPDKQADIEKAMHNWLADNSENAGETAVRAKAKLLWSELKKEVEN